MRTIGGFSRVLLAVSAILIANDSPADSQESPTISSNRQTVGATSSTPLVVVQSRFRTDALSDYYTAQMVGFLRVCANQSGNPRRLRVGRRRAPSDDQFDPRDESLTLLLGSIWTSEVFIDDVDSGFRFFLLPSQIMPDGSYLSSNSPIPLAVGDRQPIALPNSDSRIETRTCDQVARASIDAGQGITLGFGEGRAAVAYETTSERQFFLTLGRLNSPLAVVLDEADLSQIVDTRPSRVATLWAIWNCYAANDGSRIANRYAVPSSFRGIMLRQTAQVSTGTSVSADAAARAGLFFGELEMSAMLNRSAAVETTTNDFSFVIFPRRENLAQMDVQMANLPAASDVVARLNSNIDPNVIVGRSSDYNLSQQNDVVRRVVIGLGELPRAMCALGQGEGAQKWHASVVVGQNDPVPGTDVQLRQGENECEIGFDYIIPGDTAQGTSLVFRLAYDLGHSHSLNLRVSDNNIRVSTPLTIDPSTVS